MPRPNADFVGRNEQRHKKWHAADMIKMGMGQKNVGVHWPMFGQFIAQIPQPGSGIKDQHVIAATNLQGGCVAAITRGFWAWARNASAHPPEFYEKIITVRHRKFLRPEPNFQGVCLTSATQGS